MLDTCLQPFHAPRQTKIRTMDAAMIAALDFAAVLYAGDVELCPSELTVASDEGA